MTRGEAINELEILKENYWDDDGYGHETKQYDDTMLALDMAIKALEQESILDKIREQMKDYLRGVEITLEVLVENDPLRPKMEGAKDTLEECLELIDKAETEVEDDGKSDNN